eukprot:2464716-Amphidinium_carterae.1
MGAVNFGKIWPSLATGIVLEDVGMNLSIVENGTDHFRGSLHLLFSHSVIFRAVLINAELHYVCEFHYVIAIFLDVFDLCSYSVSSDSF